MGDLGGGSAHWLVALEEATRTSSGDTQTRKVTQRRCVMCVRKVPTYRQVCHKLSEGVVVYRCGPYTVFDCATQHMAGFPRFGEEGCEVDTCTHLHRPVYVDIGGLAPKSNSSRHLAPKLSNEPFSTTSDFAMPVHGMRIVSRYCPIGRQRSWRMECCTMTWDVSSHMHLDYDLEKELSARPH